MQALIAVLPGDGIGPEVIGVACQVLKKVGAQGGHAFKLQEALVGAQAIARTGTALPTATLRVCQQSQAILLGAVGGTQEEPEASLRPEQGLLDLRQSLGLFANLRPVTVHPALTGMSPLRTELLNHVDILVVRELIGGLYRGPHASTAGAATDVCRYAAGEIRRVVRVACQQARKRRGRLTSVDKANVLSTSRLWRRITSEVVRQEYPDIYLEHMLVDAAAMHLLRQPQAFDVMVTETLFGDILTDETSMLTGALGMLPSASLRKDRLGLYEPVHGSAPDIAGRGVANPFGAVLSVALLLRYSLQLEEEAQQVEHAVWETLSEGMGTPDIRPQGQGVGTAEVAHAILANLK